MFTAEDFESEQSSLEESRSDSRRGRGRHQGPHGHHHHAERRGRRRRGRGEIRATLLTLIAEQPRHGYELMQAIADQTNGRWQPSPGSVYPALQALQDEGLIVVTPDEHNRGVASLTDLGQKYMDDHADELMNASPAVDSSDGRVDLRRKVHAIGMAVKQVQAFGTTEQAKQAGEIVDEAQRRIYAILATPPSE